MNNAALDFGVQSYCFRQFADNRVVAAKVRECDLDKIELCGVHADFDAPEKFGEVVQIYREAGVGIISIGVQTFGGDDREKRWFECAALAGAKHLSAHFQVESFPRAIDKVRAWSREFGIRVGLHNHGGYAFGGQPDVIAHLLSLGAPEIGLCLDTAWALQIGPSAGNPVEWVRKFPRSIYGVHLKDFVFGPDAAWTDVVVGEGNLDVPGLLGALDESGFDGIFVLEYEGDPANPVPALRRCVEGLRGEVRRRAERLL
jgi:sugar phosphate isomerase/epimerase